MKSLESLIKLHKNELDKIIVHINNLYQQLELSIGQKEQLCQQIAHEIAVCEKLILADATDDVTEATDKVQGVAGEVVCEHNYTNDGLGIGVLGGYLQHVNKCKKDLDAQIDVLNQQIAQKKENLAEKFAEIKKYEIIKQNRLLKAKQLEQKAEDHFFDELTSNRHFANGNLPPVK